MVKTITMNEVSDGTSVNKSNEDENVTACSTCASILFDHLEPRFMVDRLIIRTALIVGAWFALECGSMEKLSERVLSDIEHRLGTALKPYLNQESGIKISSSKLAPSISLLRKVSFISSWFIRDKTTKEKISR